MRTPRSTARNISYDLRPAKQSERRILLDVLKTAAECGLPVSEYKYVGMGANRFYDFLLAYRYLGIGQMISLEHNKEMFERAKFNVPFHFIDVRHEGSSAFIGSDPLAEPTVMWFDYDGGIGPHIVADISSAALKLKVGDFFFVTVYGGPPKVISASSDENRLAWFQDELGDVSGDVTREKCETGNFAEAVHSVLVSSFRNGFAARREGEFHLLMQVEYADSTPMITIGGSFLARGTAIQLREKLAKTLPFLKDSLYEIGSFHLTERERALFDRVVTKPNSRKDLSQLKLMGFKKAEIAAYKDLMRYVPRYVETII